MSPQFRDLEDHDESVRIAVKALGDMRNGVARSDGPSSPYDSKSPPSPSTLPSSTSTAPENGINTTSPGLVSRVSQIPLVESALWAYEQGKASSRVVKVRSPVKNSNLCLFM